MNTQEIEQGFQEIWKLFHDTDRRFKETDRKFKETAEQMKETDKKVTALTGKWGRFVEGLIAPAAERLFRDRGIDFRDVKRNLKKNGIGKYV